MKLLKTSLYKCLIITPLFTVTGCLEPDYYPDYIYSTEDTTEEAYESNNEENNPYESAFNQVLRYPQRYNPPISSHKRFTTNDIEKIISITEFIEAANNLLLFALTAIIDIDCSSKINQVSNSYSNSIQQLDTFDAQFKSFLESNSPSSFLNNAEERMESIDQALDQLTDNLYQCIQEYKDQKDTLQA